jgi:hypothetical protein
MGLPSFLGIRARTRIANCLICLVSIYLFSLAAAWPQSQANTGSIEGVISDPSSRVIPGATVTVLNTDTNFSRKLTTDNEGRFRAPLLPLGSYRITVTAPSFGTLVRSGIDLAVGQTVNLQLSLSVASVEQTVNVTGDVPVVETSRVEQSTYIDKNSIRTLPNNGRNFLDFMNLTPGVAIVQGPDGNEISVNGQKGIQNNVSIDGADNNNPFFGEQRGGQRPAFTVNLDAVKEFVVVADGAPAEFGRSSGGFVNVVTKSGTNEVHGTAHEFQKWTGLTARQSDGTRLSAFSQEQFGGTIGGPIRKDKLFYFLAYDQQVFRQTKQTNAARIDPLLVAAFAKLGSPNENAPIKRTNDANALVGKIDYNLSSKNLVTMRYNYQRSRQENGTFDVDSWGTSANGIERDFANSFSGSVNTTISNTVLNEFRFQWAREDRPRPYSGPSISGQNRPFPDTGIDFAGQYRFGLPFFLPVEDHDTRIQFNDNVSIIKGAHSFKMGFEFNHTNTTQTFIGFANGRYIFDSVQGFLNYVNIGPKFVECSDGSTNNNGTCPAGTSITGPLELFLQNTGLNGLSVQQAGTQSIPQYEPALFIQDKWQIKPNLTLSYGLRWEGQHEPDPLTAPDKVYFSKFIGKPGFPSTGLIPSDYKQWQPRLGVTWDPSKKGKTVIRMSAGIFNARTPGLELASSRSTNGSIGGNLFFASFFNGFGVTPPAYTSLLPDQSKLTELDHPQVYVFDKLFRNPKTYSYSIGFDQALTSTLKFFTSFNHSKAVHLARFVNRNDPVFGSPWSTGLGATGTNGTGDLTVLESSAKSLFNGWTVGMNKQMSNKLQFQFNYQLSKDLSDDDNERDPFSYSYAVANNFKPEYNYSSRDQRHRFNAYALYLLPWGIEFSPRFSAHSAQPKSVGSSPADRVQANGSIIMRNTLRKDNEFYSFDFRLAKNWKLSERFKLAGSIDVFNLANSRNLKKPEVTSLLFNFDGTVTSGLGDPRQAQLGVKLIF